VFLSWHLCVFVGVDPNSGPKKKEKHEYSHSHFYAFFIFISLKLKRSNANGRLQTEAFTTCVVKLKVTMLPM